MSPPDYAALMSGRRRGFRAILFRLLARLASVPYRLAIGWRNLAFDRHWRAIHRVEVPVISVGNLTTGGTGKTPLVCFIAQALRREGIRVALVSRGYGRGNAASNDEALELELRLPDVPHVQDVDRVAAARIAIEELECQAIVLDDGFQHRRIARDLDIVVIDATCPYGHGYLLPRGMLREPLQSIRRAQIAVLSRSDLVAPAESAAIAGYYQRLHPKLQWFQANHRPRRLVDSDQQGQPLDELRNARAIAFCGIGNPDAFAQTIQQCGCELAGLYRLPDHAVYDRETMASLVQWCRQQQGTGRVDFVLCTEKDLVKVRSGQLAGLPLRAIEIELHLDAPEAFTQSMMGCLRNGPTEG